MDKLNKTFEQGQVLTSGELNRITEKIDEIIELLSSLGEQDKETPTITDVLLQLKVDSAKKELQRLLDEQVNHLLGVIEKIKNVPEGDSLVITKEVWEQYRKKIEDNETYISAIMESYKGIDLVSLKQDAEKIRTWAGDLTIEPGKIGLIASLFLKNPETGINELVLPPASVIAAIKDENGVLTSEVAIQADQVLIGGEVTLTGALNTLSATIGDISSTSVTTKNLTTTLDGKIHNLESDMVVVHGQLDAISSTVNDINVNNVAKIKNAIITELTAGDLTITGTLHYNKIVGGVKRITSFSQTQLEDGDYFVINEWGSTSSPSSYPTIILPMNPTAGQTLFIQCGSGCIKVKANKQIRYAFAMPIVASGITGGVTGYSVNWGTCSANDSIDVFDAKWQGVVLFIYDGSSWQQLIHNIRTTA